MSTRDPWEFDDAMPEAPPVDPSIDSTLDEPCDDGGTQGRVESWDDMRECGRLGVTYDTLRRMRQEELKKWQEAWREQVLCDAGRLAR